MLNIYISNVSLNILRAFCCRVGTEWFQGGWKMWSVVSQVRLLLIIFTSRFLKYTFWFSVGWYEPRAWGGSYEQSCCYSFYFTSFDPCPAPRTRQWQCRWVNLSSINQYNLKNLVEENAIVHWIDPLLAVKLSVLSDPIRNVSRSQNLV